MADLAKLARDADKCVACGLCVPLCPTWRETRNEAHSPRGRVMMMAQVAAGKEAGPDTANYLDTCLGCGKCEEACPSGVPYLDMLGQAKSAARPRQSRATRLTGLMSNVPGRNLALGGAVSLVRGLVRAGLGFLLPDAIRQVVPHIPDPAKLYDQIESDERVLLFDGCYGPTLDVYGRFAADMLLKGCHYRVEVPKGQVCCGALAANAGKQWKVEACERANAKALAGNAPIVATSSGCAAQLKKSEEYGGRVVEAGELIDSRCWNRLHPRPCKDGMRIAVHVPCTQRRLPGGGKWVFDLLSRILGIEVFEFGAGDACCGAGGTTWLDHPEMSAGIASRMFDKSQHLLTPRTILVSSNHSCALQLRAEASRRRIELRVTDPLMIFLQQCLPPVDD